MLLNLNELLKVRPPETRLLLNWNLKWVHLNWLNCDVHVHHKAYCRLCTSRIKQNFLSICISLSVTVLDIWGIHSKGHRCHKFDVTQMFRSLHSHCNMGCIWTVKRDQEYYPSVHIVHITTGSCLGIWDNSCVQLIKAFAVGKQWSTDGYSCGSMFRQTIEQMHWLHCII